MNKETLLKVIVNDPQLKNKYWPKAKVENLNINNLPREDNKFLQSLYFIFEEKNEVRFSYMLKNINELFQL